MTGESADVEGGVGSNQRIVRSVAAAGRARGLEVELEYAIPGGRIDVVWLVGGEAPWPPRLPLIGFEIESTWRTRKHIKGDLLNLIELQPALGVIVLAGDGRDVAATQEFARALVARHAARIEVWDDARLYETLLRPTSAASPPPPDDRRDAAGVPTGSPKYGAITAWLRAEPRDRFDVSFREIEGRLGFSLPPSSRRYPAHWSGYEGSAVVRAIRDAGWRARHVDLRAERVTLERQPDR